MIFIVILYFTWLLCLFIVGDNCMFHVEHDLSTDLLIYIFFNSK